MTRKTQKRKLRKTSKLGIWAYISGKYQLARQQYNAAVKRFFMPNAK